MCLPPRACAWGRGAGTGTEAGPPPSPPRLVPPLLGRRRARGARPAGRLRGSASLRLGSARPCPCEGGGGELRGEGGGRGRAAARRLWGGSDGPRAVRAGGEGLRGQLREGLPAYRIGDIRREIKGEVCAGWAPARGGAPHWELGLGWGVSWGSRGWVPGGAWSHLKWLKRVLKLVRNTSSKTGGRIFIDNVCFKEL